MTPERRQRIRDIFASVAVLTAAEREKALRQACGDDDALREAVVRLLEEYDRHGDAGETLLSPGELIQNRFRVRRVVGRGGMGEVYECDDIELGQPVALKALRPRARGTTEDSAVRFRREISLARRVTHPNVCRVFDLGRYSKNGVDIDFFTMELVEGETLGELLDREGPLSPEEARPLMEQMTAGLAALHDRQIIHRDLKPGNILIEKRANGRPRVVLTDFGIAGTTGAGHAFDSFATASGQIMGTPEYMAPEQMTGMAAGTPTDLYALGLVFYQMLTGKKAFPNDNNRVAPPAPPTLLNPEIPEEWERLILDCLQADITKRPQTIDAVFEALGGGPSRVDLSNAPTVAVSARRPLRRYGPWAAAAAAVLALIAVATRYPWQAPVAAEGRRVAVLPFAASENEPELQALADGLMDTITSRLSQYEGLNEQLLVVPASEVRKMDVERADMARGALGVNYAVKGRLAAQGDRVRLTLTLIDTVKMIQEDTAVINGSRSKALDLEDEAVMRLATLLDLHAQPSQVDMVATVAPGAEEFYLQGKGYIQRSDALDSVNNAIQLFERAIELDPKYARSYAGLSEALLYKSDRTEDPNWVTKADEASARAVELSPQLLEAQTARGYALLKQGRHEEALERFEEALKLSPRSADAYAGLAKSYADRANTAPNEAEKQKERKEAEAAYLKAISLRPNDWVAYKRLGLFYYQTGRYREAIGQYKIVAELAPDNAHAHANLGIFYHLIGDDDEAKRYLEKTIELDPNRVSAITNLAALHSGRGDLERAAELYERAVSKNEKSDSAWANLASLYVKLGRKSEAEQAYRRAIELLLEKMRIEGETVRTNSMLAHHYSALGEFKVGREYAQKALNSDDAFAQTDLAIAFAEMGDDESAITALRKAIAGGYPMDSIRQVESLKRLLPAIQP